MMKRTPNDVLDRLLGGIVALVIAAVAADATWMVAGTPIAAAGIPVAAILGLALASRLDGTAAGPIGAVLLMALGCTIGGALIVAVGLGANAFLLVFLIGVIAYGVPAFVLLLIPSALWGLLTIIAIGSVRSRMTGSVR